MYPVAALARGARFASVLDSRSALRREPPHASGRMPRLKIHNALPHLIECLRAWETVPSEAELNSRYLAPLEPLLRPMLEDFERYGREGLHAVVTGLDWPTYRRETLAIDPAREEARLRTALAGVARETGVALEGEVVLFGSFTLMDGYARFDRGTHRVYLGADESHGRGVYHDILFSHELTHVARESRPCVWTGWGLDPKMDHDGFTASQTVIEHLMNEGLACAVSERLVPTKESCSPTPPPGLTRLRRRNTP